LVVVVLVRLLRFDLDLSLLSDNGLPVVWVGQQELALSE
jgi:hypothetical protein